MAFQYYSARFSLKYLLLIGLVLFSLAFFNSYNVTGNLWYNDDLNVFDLIEHNMVVQEFYARRKNLNTSKLGAVLFKNEPYPPMSADSENKRFLILIYKTWELLQKRHIYYFGSTRHDPLEGCSVTNCDFTGDDKYFNKADAVIVHLHRGFIPKVKTRNLQQRWIFLDDESPRNSFALAQKRVNLRDIYDIFNWSMTYRSDADVPVPYGRTVGLKLPKLLTQQQSITTLIPNWNDKTRDVLVAILISNCGVPYRNNIIKELKLHMKIDAYGHCGDKELKNSCPGHFRADCKAMSKYLFYLVLENTKCTEYITEKMFYHAYSRGAIPIIQGPTVEDCERLLPPNSYLHIDNYDSLDDLANDIISISIDQNRLLSYHAWRNHFEVLNEHGYFGSKSYHLCRVCEAMNYNDQAISVYHEKDIKRFLGQMTLCRK